MVVRVRIGDAEGDTHRFQKGWFRQRHTALAEIVAGLERQNVAAWLHRRAFQQRRVATAVGIGVGLGDELGAVLRIQTHSDSGAGAAMRGIQDMRCQTSHEATFLSRP